jgi:hypothetical protein
MSKDNHKEEVTDYYNSKDRSKFVDNDFSVHLTRSNFSVENRIDDDRVQPDDEEKFTDLRSCTLPIDTDSGKNKLSKLFRLIFFMN